MSLHRHPDDCWEKTQTVRTQIANFDALVSYSINSKTREVSVPCVHFENVPNALVEQMVMANSEAFAVFIDEHVSELIADREGSYYQFEGGIDAQTCSGTESVVNQYGLTESQVRAACASYKRRCKQVMAEAHDDRTAERLNCSLIVDNKDGTQTVYSGDATKKQAAKAGFYIRGKVKTKEVAA